MKIKNLEISAIILMLMISNFLGNGVFALIKSSGVDSARVIFISSIVGLVILYFFMTSFNFKKEYTIREKIDYLFGKPFNYIIKTSLFGLNFILFTISLYSIMTFITSQFLANTPHIVVGILFLILVIYINIRGIDNICKTSFILLVLNLITYSVNVLGLIPDVKVDNLKPILENGIPYYGILASVTMNILPLFVLLVIPKDKIDNNKYTNKYIIGGYFISLLLIYLLMFIILGCLGSDLASFYQYPEYMILQKVNFFNFLNQLENVIDIQWIFGLFTVCSMCLYYITRMIKVKKSYDKWTIILGILGLLFSLFVYKDITNYNNFIYKSIPFVFGVDFIIHLIIVIRIKMVRRKGKVNIN